MSLISGASVDLPRRAGLRDRHDAAVRLRHRARDLPGVRRRQRLRRSALAPAAAGLHARHRQFAVVSRQMRASTLGVEQRRLPHLRAGAGPAPARILTAYTFRNSMLPVLTVTGLLLAASLGGVVFIEQIFSIPGLGSLLVDSIQSKDVPVVQAVALLIAATVFVFNLIVDVLYAVVDPRIRSAGAAR